MTFSDLEISDIFTINNCREEGRTHLFKKIQPVKVRQIMGLMTHNAIGLASNIYYGTVSIAESCEVYPVEMLIMIKDEGDNLIVMNRRGEHK